MRIHKELFIHFKCLRDVKIFIGFEWYSFNYSKHKSCKFNVDLLNFHSYEQIMPNSIRRLLFVYVIYVCKCTDRFTCDVCSWVCCLIRFECNVLYIMSLRQITKMNISKYTGARALALPLYFVVSTRFYSAWIFPLKVQQLHSDFHLDSHLFTWFSQFHFIKLKIAWIEKNHFFLCWFIVFHRSTERNELNDNQFVMFLFLLYSILLS